MHMPALPLFINEQSPLQDHINRMRSVRWGCQLAEIEARVVLRTKLSERQNHRCCWCGCRFSDTLSAKKAPSLEHIIPQSMGGTDDEDNLAVACRRCNTKRGTTDIEPFLASVISLNWNEGRTPTPSPSLAPNTETAMTQQNDTPEVLGMPFPLPAPTPAVRAMMELPVVIPPQEPLVMPTPASWKRVGEILNAQR